MSELLTTEALPEIPVHIPASALAADEAAAVPVYAPIFDETITRFRALFRGREDAFIVSESTGVRDGGKRERKYATKKYRPNKDDFRQHLAGNLSGKRYLGIYPAWRDPGDAEFVCSFGAIDIDEYDGLNIADLARRAAGCDSKIVVCRSKSGGAHIFGFVAEPVAADSMREAFRKVALALGLPETVEIFPKAITGEIKPGDYPGGAVNLPYFGTVGPAISSDGKKLELDEFIEYAEARRAQPPDPVEIEAEQQARRPRDKQKERRRYQNPAVEGNREQYLVSELARQIGAHPEWSAEQLRSYAEFLRDDASVFNSRPRDDEWKSWRVSRLCAKLVAKESAKNGDKPPGWQLTWYDQLERTKNGEPLPLLVNAMTAIEHADEWRDTLLYDEFIGDVVFAEDSPEASASKGDALEEHHVTRICAWLQREGIRVNTNTAGQAIYAVTMKGPKRVNPAREYFESIEWDGKHRAARLFIDYFGAEDHAYTAAVSECFWISAVARVMRPGAKVDTMPVLESVQGDRKSQGVEKLVPREEWFADHLPSLTDKDAVLQLRGKLIIEIGELKSLVGSKTEVVKAFLSRRVDVVRLPYGRKTVHIPRQTVFIGTTNRKDYLEDETGGRRFWPVKVGKVDVEAIARDRDQIWAEAVALYREGRKWWLDPNMEIKAAEVQESRRSSDAWEALIAKWVESPRPRVSHDESRPADLLSKPRCVLTHEIYCIGKMTATWQKSDEQRVAAILRGLGYERRKRTQIGAVRLRFYEPIERPKGEQIKLTKEPEE